MYAGDTKVAGGLVPAPWHRLASLQWMRARWTSDPCYAFFGVDGTECSFLIYLSEVEWFCPPLPWRNQTATHTAPKPLPKVQVGLGGGWASEGWVDMPAGLPRLDNPGGQWEELLPLVKRGQPALPGGWAGPRWPSWTGSQPDGARPTFWGSCKAGLT